MKRLTWRWLRQLEGHNQWSHHGLRQQLRLLYSAVLRTVKAQGTKIAGNAQTTGVVSTFIDVNSALADIPLSKADVAVITASVVEAYVDLSVVVRYQSSLST